MWILPEIFGAHLQIQQGEADKKVAQKAEERGATAIAKETILEKQKWKKNEGKKLW